MNKLYTGIAILTALGAVACSDSYEFNGELSRKDDKGNTITANVHVGSEGHLTLTKFTRPVLIEKIDDITNKYYIEDLDSKKWKLQEIVTELDDESQNITKEGNRKAFNRGQTIINTYKDSIDVRAERNLH